MNRLPLSFATRRAMWFLRIISMAKAAITVPGVNVLHAKPQLFVLATILGTINIPGMVIKNPIPNCIVTAFPTTRGFTTSLVMALYCADSATALRAARLVLVFRIEIGPR